MSKEGEWRLLDRKVILGKERTIEDRKGNKKVVNIARDPETGGEFNTWGLEVLRKRFKTPKGEIQDYIVAGGEGLNWSMVASLTEDMKVILVEQYKQGIGDDVVEHPAGMKLSERETFKELAQRELREETGFGEADEIVQLSGPLYVSTRKAETHFIPYMTTGLKRVGDQDLDPREDIEVHIMSIPEWLTMIQDGKVKDANTIATTLLMLLHLKGGEIKELFA